MVGKISTTLLSSWKHVYIAHCKMYIQKPKIVVAVTIDQRVSL